MRTLLKGTSLKAYARLTTRPNLHPIAPALLRTTKSQVKTHCTSLHHLAKASMIDPSKIEKITPARFRPGTQPDFSIYIAASKEESLNTDRALFEQGIRVYTDGSGYEGQIGASAVLFINGRRSAELRHRLGPETQHTVFEGELVLGLHLVRRINGTRDNINLNIDNQVTIKMLRTNKPQPAQYLIDKIKCDITRLHVEETARRLLNNENRPEHYELTPSFSPQGTTIQPLSDQTANQHQHEEGYQKMVEELETLRKD